MNKLFPFRASRTAHKQPPSYFRGGCGCNVAKEPAREPCAQAWRRCFRIRGRTSSAEGFFLRATCFAGLPSRSSESCSGQRGGGNYTLACVRPPCGKSPTKDKLCGFWLQRYGVGVLASLGPSRSDSCTKISHTIPILAMYNLYNISQSIMCTNMYES